MSCNRCSKKHSTVQAFLLTCHDCKRNWHHRCHVPPVSDQELVSRIKAHNAGDVANGLQAWTCKRCMRGASSVPASTPTPGISAGSSTSTHAQSISRSSSDTHRTAPSQSRGSEPMHHAKPMIPSPRSSRGNKTNDNEVIVLDDSDSDTPVPKLSQVTKSTKASASEAVRPAPVTVPSTGGSNAITNKPKGVKSTSRPSKLVHPLAREEEESSDSAQKPSLPVIVDPPPARPRKKVARRTKTVANVMATSSNITKGEVETKREEFRRRATESEKQRRDEHRRRQQEFIKAKSEERENLEQITHDVDELKLSTGQQVQNLRQDTSQPSLTPLDEIIVQTGVPRDTSPPIIITTSQRADKELEKEQELNLLPQWIHAQDNGPDIWDRASAKKAASVPPSASRRKVKAQKLGDARPPVWNFNITQWMKTMKGSPLQ